MKLAKYGFLLLSITFSFAAQSGWGKDDNAGKSKRQINEERALKLCSTLSAESYSSWCKDRVYKASFFQSEALDVCEKNSGELMLFCIEQIADRKYDGIYLEGLTSCSKYQGYALAARMKYYDYANDRRVDFNEASRGCIPNLNTSMPKSSERATYDLPQSTSLIVPVIFTIKSGKECGPIEVSKNQDVNCSACAAKLTKEDKREDGAFSLSILQIQDSKFTVTSDSISLQIVNHDSITSITCEGLATPNGEDRAAVENYFKAGGLTLKFPASKVRN